jgi:hypothetical protein
MTYLVAFCSKRKGGLHESEPVVAFSVLFQLIRTITGVRSISVIISRSRSRKVVDKSNLGRGKSNMIVNEIVIRVQTSKESVIGNVNRN